MVVSAYTMKDERDKIIMKDFPHRNSFFLYIKKKQSFIYCMRNLSTALYSSPYFKSINLSSLVSIILSYYGSYCNKIKD